ncbi:uncharacterized protein [Bactrocera oleae]|uniref:uncharacterized protein n=1 Tax=Bactrocera oleae TaxID=104688 RepID=UPI00387E93F1
MSRNLFMLLFGTSLLVSSFLMTNAQFNVSKNVLPVSLKPIIPRPSIPARRPIPTSRPRPPTRIPSLPPIRQPSPPTRRPNPPTLRPTPPTRRRTWTVTITVTRRPRMITRALCRHCSKSSKCRAAGPSLCVCSRNKKLCRRVANRCTLRKLNCQAKPRNKWGITQQKRCAKLKVGAKAAKCKD